MQQKAPPPGTLNALCANSRAPRKDRPDVQLRTVVILAATVVLVSLTASCGNNTVPGASPVGPGSRSSSAATSPRPSEDLGDAQAVLTKIKTQVGQVSLNKVYSEDDDPNKLLGRPNGYTSKVAFRDTRINQKDQDDIDARSDAIERGGSIEVFPDDAGAKARADYIQGMLKGGGLGSEYDYVRGSVVVRVTGDLAPSKARTYEEALAKIN